ncbi:MAG TPA: extracellular solute-binding protein [Alphaproteobacteria bacterium]|jgi:iron(III) transport system substrate-binding protein
MKSLLSLVGGIALPLVATLVMTSNVAVADNLVPTTKKYLQSLKLSEDVMNGLDQDLTVPQEWLDGANKEGTVKVMGTWTSKEFGVLNAPFAERFPKVKVVYTEGKTMNARAVAPLVAFKQGQFLTDVLTGFGGAAVEFKAAKALEPVTGLPGFKNQVDGANDPDGTWAALRMRYWCIGYNTNAIKEADMPKTWDDLLESPVLRNGNLGIGNRPQLWVLMLRTDKGKEWTENFLDKFFNVVKPQFRNEGMDALLGILAAGEVNAALPTAEYNIKGFETKGAPVAWHCPEPVPLAPSQLGIMQGNPHPNAARVWTNWMLSREGQVAQFVADGSPPSHKGLQTKDFLPYADQIIGKKLIQADEQYNREMYAMWQKYWK